MPVREISPQDLKVLLDSDDAPILIDVRQPEEYELVRIEGSTLIPLNELPERVAELKAIFADASGDVVIYCRSGGRSGTACEFLHEQGLVNAINLRGGINAYAREADQTLTPY